MDFTFSEEQNHLRQEIIEFAQQELNAGLLERDRTQTFPHDLWLKCGQLGLPGIPVSESYGGRGLDSLSTAIALEALGYGCHDGGLILALGAHLFGCVVSLWQFGTEAQKKHYLPDLCRGHLIAVNGMTEAGSGSDAFSMSTEAIPDGDGYRLSGRKIFASNAPVADLALVYALTDASKGYLGGITAFLVDQDSPGFQIGPAEDKMGVRTCQMGELIFDDVYLPPEAVLGGVGGGGLIFSHAMNWERICLFAAHVGTIERLLEQVIQHARTRAQFGQPIGKFQAVSHRIADMKVQLEAARLLIYQAAWKLGHERQVGLEAAIAKLFVSESLVRAALEAIHIFGGSGYLTEFGLERTLRDAIGSTIYSGTSDIQRNIIARQLGL